MANAVWLKDEEAILRAFISPSVMVLTGPSKLARVAVPAMSAWIARPQPAQGRHRMTKEKLVEPPLPVKPQ